MSELLLDKPLLGETREAENLEKMKELAKQLTVIAEKIGLVIQTRVPFDESTKKQVKEIVDDLKNLNKEYKLTNFFSVLKGYTDDQLDNIKNGVSKMFTDNNSEIIVNNENETVTIKSPSGTKIMGRDDLILEETCNPMHQGGSIEQYGGFDPFTVFAMGFAGTAGTAVAITIMTLLSFIYLGLCFLVYSGALNGFLTLIYLFPCIPVGLLLFLNSLRKDIKKSCSSRKGGKLKTARKRFLIKKHRKSKRKKSKKSRK